MVVTVCCKSGNLAGSNRDVQTDVSRENLDSQKGTGNNEEGEEDGSNGWSDRQKADRRNLAFVPYLTYILWFRPRKDTWNRLAWVISSSGRPPLLLVIRQLRSSGMASMAPFRLSDAAWISLDRHVAGTICGLPGS